MTDTVNSPDALKSDPDSRAFYVLRNEQLVICKSYKEVPYWENRSSYLSMGRYSPKFKKVVFWPDPVNPGRAMQLLKENLHIEGDYTYAVAGSATKAPKIKRGDPLKKMDGVRRRAVEVLMERGMKRQERADHSEETDTSKTSDQ